MSIKPKDAKCICNNECLLNGYEGCPKADAEEQLLELQRLNNKDSKENIEIELLENFCRDCTVPVYICTDDFICDEAEEYLIRSVGRFSHRKST